MISSAVLNEDFYKSIQCECAKRRAVTAICNGDGTDKIAEILPKGFAALVISERENGARDYMRKLRKKGISSRFRRLVGSEKPTDIEVGEDIGIIVAFGGDCEADFAKRLGKEKSLPVVVIVASPDCVNALNGLCAVRDGKRIMVEECAVPAAAAFADEICAEGELPAAFGNICAAGIELFDMEAYARATGKTVCPHLRESAFDLIYKALDAVTGLSRGDARLPLRLAEIALKLSYIMQGYGTRRIVSGADACALTAEMLFGYEERKPMARGEFAFVFGAVLCSVYREFAVLPSVFLPPPDNNKRAELLSEYLGLEPMQAARCAVNKIKNVGLAAYRIREYRDESESVLSDACKIFEEGKRYFKRLHADDGYSLKNAIEASDVKTVISLAPDAVSQGANALTLMREFGLLERYL